MYHFKQDNTPPDTALVNLRCGKACANPEKFLYATERRPWQIIEAFAEIICRLGAHRSSRRNGISEGSHKPFRSQPTMRAVSRS